MVVTGNNVTNTLTNTTWQYDYDKSRIQWKYYNVEYVFHYLGKRQFWRLVTISIFVSELHRCHECIDTHDVTAGLRKIIERSEGIITSNTTNKNIATYNKSITFLTLVGVANTDMHDMTACLRKIFECNESITTLNASFVTMRLARVNVDRAMPAHTCRALWRHY